jgi:hypothetical protein
MVRRTPEEAARLLTQGILDRRLWPELALEEFAAEVSGRLAAVGLELASGDGHWVARSQDREPPEGFEAIFSLDQLELAVLAALYLHLRYLPRRSATTAAAPAVPRRGEEPSVAVEDIDRGLPGYKVSKVQMVVGRLKNAHFVRQHNGRLYAGPYLAALDEVVADDRATELLRDFRLQRFLQRAVRGEAELHTGESEISDQTVGERDGTGED